MKLKFDLLIGIESHVQLSCNKKLFSFINKFNNNLNNNLSLFDLGLPGVLPVLNFFFIDKIILLGLFIKSDIYNISFFLRKNYFYPDVSKNYQITQNIFSFLKKGYILIYNNYVFNSYYKLINIKHIHFEEDTAKIIYKNNLSHLDYNRSGSILLEIVSFPDISNVYESILYINNLRYFLNFLNISDCNMESGSFRFDVNFSLRKLGCDISDYRVELKNLNSFNSLFKILDYEIKRLIYFYLNNNFINSHTIGYDSLLNLSFIIRDKENFFDYKYFIDPDLFYITLKNKNIYYIFNKLFNWFYYFKFFNLKLKKKYFLYFIFYKKCFYLFLILGFYYKNYFQVFTLIFKQNIFFKNILFIKHFSFEYIILLFNLYFYKYIVYKNLKKICFFILKNKFFNIFFIYKVIFFNFINIEIDIFYIKYFLNDYILFNLYLIHNYIFNKNLFNNFVSFFLKKNITNNCNLLSNIYKKKIFIYREMDEWFKSRN